MTGANGFIGARVLEGLLARGHRVRALGRTEPAVRHPHLTHQSCDIARPATCRGTLSGAGIVIHLAAAVPQIGASADEAWLRAVNVGGTVALVDEAVRAGVDRFVYASSWTVYGNTDGVLDEQTRRAPADAYARTKLEAEDAIIAQAEELNPMVLRIANTYGERPSQHGAVIELIRSASKGIRPELHGGGRHARDYIYVDDVARAFVQALDGPVPAERVLNIGSGTATALDTLWDVIRDRYAQFGIGAPAAAVINDAAPSRRWLNIDRARAAIGFAPGTSLADGLERVILWWERRTDRRPAAVIFDIDGTLVDVTLRYSRAYAIAALRRHLIPPSASQVLDLKKTGRSGLEIIRELYPELDHAARMEIDNERAALTESDDLLSEDRLVPDALSSLAALRAMGMRVGLVTYRPPELNAHLDRSGLTAYVDAILNVPRTRDKGDAFREVARMLDTPTLSCVAVGDAPRDIADAKRVGMRAYAVTYGLVAVARLEAATPDGTIDRLTELVDLLRSERRRSAR